MSDRSSVEAFALSGIPEVRPDDDIAAFIADAMEASGRTWEPSDIVVVAQKIVSKAENRIRHVAEIEPGREAREISAACGKDARKVQAILDESTDILRVVPARPAGLVIARHVSGWVCANAGIDESNLGGNEGQLLLLPVDPDASARRIAHGIAARTAIRPGVIVTDTFGRAWRNALVNVAIGLSDVPPIIDWVGQKDAFGRELQVSQQAFADEIAAASGLLMPKDAATPVVIFRGLQWRADPDASARRYVRPLNEDLFK
ncbi:coenzyme F420-0:L-glutamate ligase [Caballeronia sp. LZ035]|uniref:coenzyme F420-0:L-glutamate ligase n=1 Tax=Caballeronia sp. LZ035 TaxID=3038568 RepID=UPI00285CEC50|nr:coenzyme F420-0:L-glutamate ligase [Caballeronia sp. LZ035]MDR5761398.1 coenzyme F420-0:L-glutamate ligase [Caballeronia sp. LZ035]